MVRTYHIFYLHPSTPTLTQSLAPRYRLCGRSRDPGLAAWRLTYHIFYLHPSTPTLTQSLAPRYRLCGRSRDPGLAAAWRL
ncbi:hypothetical protein J6590_008490 [Homalodisca vitripennis]|nr:hypothetical protein J6590_008490 [Homalodisca vitripennis]